jgi:hypothetical protein
MKNKMGAYTAPTGEVKNRYLENLEGSLLRQGVQEGLQAIKMNVR